MQLNNISKTIACYCSPVNQCPDLNGTCFSTTGCFHSVTLDATRLRVVNEVYGCFANHTNQFELHCRNKEVANQMVYCCSFNEGYHCNKNLTFGESFNTIHEDFLVLHVLIVVAISLLIFGFFTIILLWKFVFKKRLKTLAYFSQNLENNNNNESVNLLVNYFKTIEGERISSKPFATDNADDNSENKPCSRSNMITCTSGSGSGLPFLVQQTIARQIQLLCCIGKGRFGEVWKANCQGETVAVKVFSSRDEASWARETDIYNTGLLKHPNLLAYYASDIISRGGCTQLWLVTAYHTNGSLHDYLSNKSLKLHVGLHLAYTIASGLAFLHNEIKGFHNKPSIAHRDLKSKNVLVMQNNEACIADLGLALVYSDSNSISPVNKTFVFSNDYMTSSGITQTDCLHSGGFSMPSLGPPPAGPRVGTKRYMSPELLINIDPANLYNGYTLSNSYLSNDVTETEDHANYLPFEAYQASDVYALALIFWELARCTEGFSQDTSDIEGYQIPFYDLIPVDPTFVQMRNIVCADLLVDNMKPDENGSVRCRPLISPRWEQDCYLKRFSQLICECWHRDWSARLSTLRVRKRLEQLETMLVADKSNVI